jgi:hypothetical protein
MNVRLALRTLGACPLGAASGLELTALGDFPSRSLRADGSELTASFEPLPPETRELALRVASQRGGFGRRVLAQRVLAEPEPLWLLPPDDSCPLADDLARALEGAAVVALPPAALLFLGGAAGSTLASSDALLLGEGSEVVTPVPGGMLLRRAYASASVLGERVVVAGGTADLRGGAHDTYEVFDAVTRQFDAAQSGKLQEPRMQHASLALPEGRLLLAGGRAESGGLALASAEVLDPQAGTSDLLEDARGLTVGRINPKLLALDSGSVFLAAGSDAAGGPIGSVERFDGTALHFEVAADDLPVRGEVAVATLPGARIAWLTCDAGAGASCRLELLLERADGLERAAVPLRFDDLAPAGLRELQLLALGGGRLLLTAADDSDPSGRRRAYLIDPVEPSITRATATRVPRWLVGLASGAVAEIDGAGMSLRAATTLGPYACPDGDLTAAASPFLALDAPEHWQRETDGLRAQRDGARFDLAELRAAAFRLEWSVDGPAELLLYDGQSAQLSIARTSTDVSTGTCRVPLATSDTLVLERRGAELSLHGSQSSPCTTKLTGASLGVGVRAARATLVRRLTLERL